MTAADGPLRVAQVLAGAPVGGAENFYSRLVTSLAEEEQLTQRAFVRHTALRKSQFQKHQVSASFHRFGGKLDLWGRRQFRQQLRHFQPDVVLTWMNRASGLTPKGDYTLVNRLGHYYNLKYYRHADYWIGITKGICDHLIQGGMPPQRVVHIANFADEHPVEAVPRTAFDTPESVPLILAAGRLHTNKGFDVLLNALRDLPDAYLWLAGSGPQEKYLQSLIQHYGLSERVRLLGWRSDVNALMRSVDLFVCPSRHEGLGSIVLEAWSQGCPQVATRSQGPAELITDGENGLLVDIDDSDQLAKAIHRLLDSPALREDLQLAGQRHYQAYFSRATITRQYVDFLSTVSKR